MRIFEISNSLLDGIRNVHQEEGLVVKKIAKVIAAVLLLLVSWFADLCYLAARTLFVVREQEAHDLSRVDTDSLLSNESPGLSSGLGSRSSSLSSLTLAVENRVD
jgi:hypothetical protein